MALENWVVLEPGVTKKLHFYAHKFVDRVITDVILKRPRTVKGLNLYVDEEDGEKVDKVYSVLSAKHAGEFSGYLEGERYKAYDFKIIKDAPGTVPPRIQWVIPR